MATVYTLTAVLCPVPVIPSAILSIAGETPLTWTPVVAAASGSGSLVSKFNKNAVRGDVLGRAGAGAIGVDWDSGSSSSIPGLNITTTGALNVTVGTGQAMIDGPVQITTPTVVAGITDNIARIYLWLSQAGVITPVNNSLTPPAGMQCFIGSVVTAAGAVTEINGSGVCYFLGPHLVRRTADTGTPTDTPPSGLSLFTQCPGGLFYWDGSQYRNLTHSGRVALTFGSDANKTLSAAEAENQLLDFVNSGTAISVTRNVVVPLAGSKRWTVRNNSAGGQSIQAIGASGTGITIATGKTAVVGSDATNIFRITADL